MTPPHPRTALVRPHVVTGGRARARREFDVVTLVTAADHAATASPRGANPEQLQIMTLCRSGVLSVADIAGHLGLAVGFTKILLDDLVASGHVTTLAPAPESPSLELLQEVLDGLHRL
jgi:hypothetical protein